MIPFLPVAAAAQTAPVNGHVRREDADAPPAGTAFGAVFANDAQTAERPVPMPQSDEASTEDGLESLIRDATTARRTDDPLSQVLVASQAFPRNEVAVAGTVLEGARTAQGRFAPDAGAAQTVARRSEPPVDGTSLLKASADIAAVQGSGREGDRTLRTHADLTERLQTIGAEARLKASEGAETRTVAEPPQAHARAAGDALRAVGGSIAHATVRDPRVAVGQTAAPPADRPAKSVRQGPAPLWETAGTDDRTARSQTVPAPNLGAAASPQFHTLRQGGDLTEKATKALDPALGLGNAVAERTVSQPALAAGPAAQRSAPDAARHAASQMAVAIAQKAGQPTEIALQPEELGRVRMSLSVVENSVTMTVFADRPETADLLRRHIDVLAQEFRTLGYADISFEFGGEGGSGSETGVGDRTEARIAEPIDAREETVITPPSPEGGLDLRI